MCATVQFLGYNGEYKNVEKKLQQSSTDHTYRLSHSVDTLSVKLKLAS